MRIAIICILSPDLSLLQLREQAKNLIEDERKKKIKVIKRKKVVINIIVQVVSLVQKQRKARSTDRQEGGEWGGGRGIR